MEILQVKKLRLATVYKIVAIGLGVGFPILGVFLGILGALDIATVNWNNEPVVGAKAILVSPIICLIMAGVFTVIIGSVMGLGLWIYSKIKPISIEFVSE